MKKKYNIIYADPPWHFSNANVKKAGAPIRVNDYYDVMDPESIAALPIAELAEKDSVLFMWTTDAHLEFALDIMKKWGFKYKTMGFVWVKRLVSGKPAVILGPWGMKSHELCLLGTKGKGHSLLTARNTRQLIESVRRGHSMKPEEAYERIEAMFPGLSKVELFARANRGGWDAFGNEVPNSITI